MPSQSLHAVKRTRDFLRSILTENRRPQFALKELAYSCLKHYPYDYVIEDKWDLEKEGSISKQHECCTDTDSVQLKDCIRILSGIATDPKTSKFRKDEIMTALKGVTLQGRESDWSEVQDKQCKSS